MSIIQKLLYIEINVFALAVLLLIFLNIRRKTERYLLEQKLFIALLGANAFILILDTLMWLLDGDRGVLKREIYLVITAMYYAMNPIICMVWAFHADYLVNKNEKRLKKLLIPLLIPAGVNLILSFLSISNGYLFYIDESNIYHRGSFFLLMAAISYFYLLYSFLYVLLKQKSIQKQYFIPVLVFAIPPFVGGIIQTFFYGVSLVWICMTISVLIVFINIQNDQLYTDYLTGVNNRRHLDRYLQQLNQSKSYKGILAGIMLDLDLFKLINDLFGHDCGDEALKAAADILKKTFRKNDFISRYGGDEFIIILDIKEKSDLNKTVKRLRDNALQYNLQKTGPYTINFSLGYDCYDNKRWPTFQEFIIHLDSLMYKDKQNQNNGTSELSG